MREIDHILAGLESYLAHNELKQAAAYLDESLGRVDELAPALNARGLAALEMDDLTTAHAALRAAAALRSGDAVVQYNLAEVCRRVEDYTGAMEACRTAVEIDPTYVEAARLLESLTKAFGTEPSTLYAFYDLAVAPVTFDFVTFLVLAEIERRHCEADALRVIFVPGRKDGFRRYSTRDHAFNRARKEWRVQNIQVPACRLVRACSGSVVCVTRAEADAYVQRARGKVFPPGYSILRPRFRYQARHLVQAAAEGLDVRVLEATPQAKAHVTEWLQRHTGGRAAISITLRQSDFQPVRNSNIVSWSRFARWLTERNFAPVVVPDTEAYLAGNSARLEAGIEYPAAALNIELRAALYDGCLVNLMVGGGPGAICISGTQTRYLMFLLVRERAVAASPEWFVAQGMPPGIQPSFTGRFQRYVWADDTLETIVTEFEAMLAELSEARMYRV